MIVKNTIIVFWGRNLDYLIKGCLLLGGLGVQGGWRRDRVRAGGHVWDLSLDEVNGKVAVAFGLRWLLLKGLEHLLKLRRQKQKKKY